MCFYKAAVDMYFRLVLFFFLQKKKVGVKQDSSGHLGVRTCLLREDY